MLLLVAAAAAAAVDVVLMASCHVGAAALGVPQEGHLQTEQQKAAAAQSQSSCKPVQHRHHF
jgi:hypothetical protein